ncbi:MAG: NAD(P)H-dependent oxidoreductase [Fusobacteriaceae bacterium]|nr:NAD(P)H-dependent oxidoreductase [Fusobacteriaceae bacterium]MBN2837491.1 NAD(P)H-dependent oxidoreductase [Fusobacteriaceae bacterium]
MKILGISAGTKNGSNDAVCKEALMGAKEMGADVEFIRVLDLDIKHCTGCIACVKALMTGKGNLCSLKDDFEWLLDKMLNADGIVIAAPIFEKGTAGIIRTITDRFGPRMDRGNNVISDKIATATDGKKPDTRILKDKVISFMGVGGSDWGTRIECDHAMLAMTPMWKVIDNVKFQWSKKIIVEDEKIELAHQIGKNLVEAANDMETASFRGTEGVCPHCHSRNFYLSNDSTHAVCCLCGIEGDIVIEYGRTKFIFPEEQISHTHNTLSGKFIHGNDIKRMERELIEIKKTDEYKNRVKKYSEFLIPIMPQK